MPLPPINGDSGERQTLNAILDWRAGMLIALIEQRGTVQGAIRIGYIVEPRFVGMTHGDLDNYFDAHRLELDRLTVLNLMASAEASIRVDYFRRVGEKLKDPLARAYQAFHKGLSARKQLRPDFDEGGILDQIKQQKVMDNNIVGRYRECLVPRNWFGHGRYWAKPVEVDRLDPDEVYDRAQTMLKSMPL